MACRASTRRAEDCFQLVLEDSRELPMAPEPPHEDPPVVASSEAEANPYAVTQLDDAREASQNWKDDPNRPPSYGRAFVKWSLVCIVSAAPSFFWGCITVGAGAEQIVAMSLGIATFILGYTFLEMRPFMQRFLKRPFVRVIAKVGYGTRIIVSIAFPVGMGIDLWVGLASTTITDVLLQTTLVRGFDQDGFSAGFIPVYMNTIVQGILLNFILLAYMSVIWLIVWLFDKATNRKQSPDMMLSRE